MWQRLKELYYNRHNLKENFAWLLNISSPHKMHIAFLMLINCSITAVGVATAAVNKYIVDRAVVEGGMIPYAVLAVLLTVFSLTASVGLSLITVRVTEKYSYHIRSEMYRNILNSIWKKRTAYHSESLLSRMTSDASSVTNGVITVSVEIISTILQFVLAFLLLWHYEASLAIVALISGPVAAFVSVYIGTFLKKIQTEIQQSEAVYREFLQEHLSHADVVKIFGQEENSIEKLRQLQSKRFYWIKKKNKLSVLSAVAISVVFSGTYLFAFISGALKIASGDITFGTMTAFLSLMGQVQTPILSLAGLIPQFVSILASTGRIVEVFNMDKEDETQIESNKLKSPLGLAIKNLTLSYEGDAVVDGFSMTLQPGETVMIAGSSGIGKTTLLRSILGLLHPDNGSLEFFDNNGNVISCCAGSRKYISYVPQGNTLFSGTIETNLKVGKPDATDEEMQMALEAACAWDFVKELPNGINTTIGERSGGISEGQAQRIAIARAFLKPFELLVLDEATSALDEETERKILENLKKIKKGKTCLFVSHRKSVSEYADKVVEIK